MVGLLKVFQELLKVHLISFGLVNVAYLQWQVAGLPCGKLTWQLDNIATDWTICCTPPTANAVTYHRPMISVVIFLPIFTQLLTPSHPATSLPENRPKSSPWSLWSNAPSSWCPSAASERHTLACSVNIRYSSRISPQTSPFSWAFLSYKWAATWDCLGFTHHMSKLGSSLLARLKAY